MLYAAIITAMLVIFWEIWRAYRDINSSYRIHIESSEEFEWSVPPMPPCKPSRNTIDSLKDHVLDCIKTGDIGANRARRILSAIDERIIWAEPPLSTVADQTMQRYWSDCD